MQNYGIFFHTWIRFVDAGIYKTNTYFELDYIRLEDPVPQLIKR